MSDDAYGPCSTLLGLVRAGLAGSAPITTGYVGAGFVAWDDCCGQLVVAPERVYRSERFPVEFAELERCSAGFLVIDVVVLLVRCVPVVDDQGHPPAVAALDGAYAAVLADAATVWQVMAGPLPDNWERAGLNQTFLGAEGGCIGVETRMKVGIDQDVWP